MKRISLLALALAASFAGTAAAQAPDAENPLTGNQPTPPPQPQPQPTAPPPPAPVAAPAPAPVASEPVGDRPEGNAIGIGAGYLLNGTSLETPNFASVRVRLASGLQIEPLLVVQTQRESVNNNGTTATGTINTLLLGADFRYPIMRRGKFDLEALGAFSVGNVSTTPAMTTDSTTSFSVSWGLAVEYWATHHLAVSMTAENPLLNVLSDTPDTSMNSGTTNTTIGLVFEPEFILAVHLYN